MCRLHQKEKEKESQVRYFQERLVIRIALITVGHWNTGVRHLGELALTSQRGT